MSMDKSRLTLNLLKKKAELDFNRLRSCSEELENLLAAEAAKTMTNEVISDASARAYDPSLEPEEPSDRLLDLMDSLPAITRASLLIYFGGAVERLAIKAINIGLERRGKPPLRNDIPLPKITKTANDQWAGTIASSDIEMINDIGLIRHCCAHSAGVVDTHLKKGRETKEAAERRSSLGVEFTPSPSLTNNNWTGTIKLLPIFSANALDFYERIIRQILAAAAR